MPSDSPISASEPPPEVKRTLTPREAYAEREERLRPRRVVAVDEHRLGAVHRQRLGVRDEALDREPQVQPLLDRALRQHAGPAGLRADEDRDRVQRRVARDADRRLELGEAARRRLGRVGGEQRRVLLQVRHVRLVRGRAARAQLLQREHQLDRVEHRDHAREPRRRQSAREAHELARAARRRRRACRAISASSSAAASRGDLEVEPVARDEVVERVPVLSRRAVELDDAAVLDHERRLRIVRPVHRDEPELGERLDQHLAAQLALLARDEPRGALVSRQGGLARA